MSFCVTLCPPVEHPTFPWDWFVELGGSLVLSCWAPNSFSQLRDKRVRGRHIVSLHFFYKHQSPKLKKTMKWTKIYKTTCKTSQSSILFTFTVIFFFVQSLASTFCAYWSIYLKYYAYVKYGYLIIVVKEWFSVIYIFWQSYCIFQQVCDSIHRTK